MVRKTEKSDAEKSFSEKHSKCSDILNFGEEWSEK